MKLRIKELRKKRGWSQEAAAAKAGISRSYYTNIELGNRHPNILRLQQIAEIFGVTAYDLLADPETDYIKLEIRSALDDLPEAKLAEVKAYLEYLRHSAEKT